MPSDIQQFERTFADLAYASLKSRAPMLMDHLVGWQLVDSSEDETRAVGIFGFKLGEQWLYKPVFFMNGELKGSELLYLKNQDIFVPLQENWINYIVNRKPFVLGQPEEQTLEQLGYQAPDFTQYAVSPAVAAKRASDDSETKELTQKVAKGHDWAKDAVQRIFGIDPFSAAYEEAYKKSAARMDLPTFLKKAGVPAFEAFVKAMGNEKFAQAVLQFYDLDALKKAMPTIEDPRTVLKEAADDIKETRRIIGKPETKTLVDNQEEDAEKSPYTAEHRITDAKPDVVVIMPGSGAHMDVLQGLEDDEKERLMGGEIVIRDHRKDTTEVFPADIHKTLFNPSESGVYDVLIRDGTFRKLFVSAAPHGMEHGGSVDRTTLLFDPATKAYNVVHPGGVFAKKKYYDESCEKFFDALPKGRSFTRDHVYAFFGPNGNSTVPIRVWEVDKGNDERTYLRYSAEHGKGGQPKSYLGNAYKTDWRSRNNSTAAGGSGGPSCCFGSSGNGLSVVLGNVPAKNVRVVGDTIFIPDSWKAVEVTKELDAQSQIAPGDLADITMHISKMGSQLVPMKLYDDGHEIHISAGDAHLPPMAKPAAVRSLIIDWGLKGTDAMALLKQAETRTGVRVNLFLKTAQTPSNRVSNMVKAPVPAEASTAAIDRDVDPILGVEGHGPYIEQLPVLVPQDPIPQRPFYATANYNKGGRDATNSAMQEAVNAAQSGQKDVFDMATIGRLAKTVDVGEVVDQYQSDLINGMDRVGRILFMFYWHYDKFAERYGKEDLPELEDSMKSVFKQTGDLVLFLKQKSIEPDVNIGLPLMAGGTNV